MNIKSEVAPLKKVILHEPDLDLERLTPENCKQLLFDDVLWPERAKEEHKVFQKTLEDNGVQVFLLKNLLTETLNIPEAKAWLLKKQVTFLHDDSEFSKSLMTQLTEMSSENLARHLIGGVSYGELKQTHSNLTSKVMADDEFALPPLPNHLFTRDTTCWVGNGVSINPMHYPARRCEAANFAAIYRFHPMFAKASFKVWLDGAECDHPKTTIEGGDVLVLNDKCLMIGVSQRTTPQAIEAFAKNLFKHDGFEKILAIELPRARASMHLDTLMTMISEDTFCMAYPDADYRTWSIQFDDQHDQLIIEEEKASHAAIAKALSVKQLNIISLTSSRFIQMREQWSDASNLLAIAPGKVIAYERNIHTNKKLKQAGIEVFEIPGSELGRGRGGSRCMSCPIEREHP